MYWDEKLPAFGIRVGKHTKTWVVIQGKERRITTIGHYPETSLQDAKKKARLALASGTPLAPQAYAEAVQSFLDAQQGRIKATTAAKYRYYLELLTIPKNLAEISKTDVSVQLAHYNGKAHSQNYAYATFRAFFNWCMDQGYIESHPLIRGKIPNKTRGRDRVLSDDELGRIWRCTEDNTYGRIVRLLMLTGQRKMEVKGLKPEDVKDGTITFHTKGDKLNVLPLTPLVQDNLNLPFKFNNWSEAKVKLDTECGVEWRQHDLRRTLATKLAEMGVAFIVIERILGHAQTGVAWTYQRYNYMKEIKEALLLYEEHIRKILKPALKLVPAAHAS